MFAFTENQLSRQPIDLTERLNDVGINPFIHKEERDEENN
jgi:hypothetical protein